MSEADSDVQTPFASASSDATQPAATTTAAEAPQHAAQAVLDQHAAEPTEAARGAAGAGVGMPFADILEHVCEFIDDHTPHTAALQQSIIKTLAFLVADGPGAGDPKELKLVLQVMERQPELEFTYDWILRIASDADAWEWGGTVDYKESLPLFCFLGKQVTEAVLFPYDPKVALAYLSATLTNLEHGPSETSNVHFDDETPLAPECSPPALTEAEADQQTDFVTPGGDATTLVTQPVPEAVLVTAAARNSGHDTSASLLRIASVADAWEWG